MVEAVGFVLFCNAMTQLSNIRLIIGASTIAVIALVFLQVRWLIQAKNLIETDFEQKVQMALCYAVEKSSSKDFAFNTLTVCQPIVGGGNDNFLSESFNENTLPNRALQEALDAALMFYDIDLDYEMAILDGAAASMSCNVNSPYCCSLSPFQMGGGDRLLNIQFPNKTQYVLGRIGFMLTSSILILLFISIVFLLANYTLLRQKRISELNVDFFNNMAHEFRTPLTNISLANKLLVKNNRELKDNGYLAIVKRENKKLLQQIERVLHLAKLEKGEYLLQKSPVNLKDLVEEVVADMDMQIKEQGAKIEVYLEERGERRQVRNNDLYELKLKSDFSLPTPHLQTQDWQIEGDRLHLGNAFRNLIDNALKYSEKETNIEIVLQKKDRGIVLSFKDNGIGIPKNEQVYVFEKFGRVANQNVHNQKGFGLGLSYVKMIVERHNGFVELVSDWQKGCRFDLYLPKNE